MNSMTAIRDCDHELSTYYSFCLQTWNTREAITKKWNLQITYCDTPIVLMVTQRIAESHIVQLTSNDKFFTLTKSSRNSFE